MSRRAARIRAFEKLLTREASNMVYRRIGIVALARKLPLALWRYLETGVVPEGAVLKA